MSMGKLEVLLDVHRVYLRILNEVLGRDVPLPAGLPAEPGSATSGAETIELLERWLAVLDLAISAPMVRDTLKEHAGTASANSLLQYYVYKSKHSETDRDKLDFVVTCLFRAPDTEDAWDPRGLFFGGPKIVPPFEQALLRKLGMAEVPPLAEEHRQLVREFEFICEEVEDYRHFDALIDSGVMQRVREIKHSLAESFYHPHVLANVAAYNVFFGVRFDRLFHEATVQIKSFAEKLQSEGGSIMSRVDGDVIVQELAKVEEEKILDTEYGRAQEEFRKLSRYKKAVDNRRGTRDAAVAAAAAAPKVAPSRAPSAPAASHIESVSASFAGASAGSFDIAMEEGKLKTMEDTIRNFVRAADPGKAHVVPVRYGNLALTPAEAEAFRADYGSEKSFRADFANVLTTMVALIGRIGTELADFKSNKHSAYLWKPHADALAHLLTLSKKTAQKANEVADVAAKRGLKDKVGVVQAAAGKLKEHTLTVTQTLQSIGSQERDRY